MFVPSYIQQFEKDYHLPELTGNTLAAARTIRYELLTAVLYELMNFTQNLDKQTASILYLAIDFLRADTLAQNYMALDGEQNNPVNFLNNLVESIHQAQEEE